jgi:hypothetical protein
MEVPEIPNLRIGAAADVESHALHRRSHSSRTTNVLSANVSHRLAIVSNIPPSTK